MSKTKSVKLQGLKTQYKYLLIKRSYVIDWKYLLSLRFCLIIQPIIHSMRGDSLRKLNFSYFCLVILKDNLRILNSFYFCLDILNDSFRILKFS